MNWKPTSPLAWLNGLACVALLAMMLLVAADVAGRYLIGHPLPGAIELVQYAMVFVVFSALPTVTLKRRHISLDVLHDRLGGWDGYASSKPAGPITFKHGLEQFNAMANAVHLLDVCIP